MTKRFIRIAIPLCVVIVLFGALAFKTAGARAATLSLQVSQNRASSCSLPKWSVVPSPTPSNNGGLAGVAAVSARNIWAVGGSGNQRSGGQTLIEHWNGANWQIVPSPSPSSFYNHLYAVSVVSADNVWTVGYDVNASQATESLVEHWNGKQWSVVASPSPGSINNELFSVAAVSARDIWAVGFTTNSALEQTTLIEHWNGKQWSVVTSPSPGSNDVLSGVAAISARDVWAVGASNTLSQTLTEHWNGKHWSVVTSPNPGSGGVLSAVAAVSARDVWAVGYATSNGSIQSLVERWNGTHWQVVTSPNAGTNPIFWAVAALSARDVWAVGSENGTTVFFQTLTEHWNGKQWSVVASPSPGSFNTQLVGVTALSVHNVWAVGHADGSTLIEQYHC